jgi:hypothetical protein
MEHLQTKSVAQVLGFCLSLWHHSAEVPRNWWGRHLQMGMGRWLSVEFPALDPSSHDLDLEATNIHRDTMASHVGHYTRLALGTPDFSLTILYVSILPLCIPAGEHESSTYELPIYLSIICMRRQRQRQTLSQSIDTCSDTHTQART